MLGTTNDALKVKSLPFSRTGSVGESAEKLRKGDTKRSKQMRDTSVMSRKVCNIRKKLNKKKNICARKEHKMKENN